MADRPVLTTAWIIDGPDGARIQKADRPSQQLTTDPFGYSGTGAEGGLQRPPHDMDALIGLLGATSRVAGNTLHASCVRQKATDVLGRGITLRARAADEGKDASAEEEDRWGEFVRSVEDAGDGSFKERLTWAHQDYEAVGWGVLEVSRSRQGVIDGLWHVPGHTVRAHGDGRRFAQKRGDKTVWFKRFGVDGTVSKDTGAWAERTSHEDFAGNELIVVRNYTPGSSWYGSPDMIPALAAIAGWTAQAEFNVRFFGNHAIPSYAVIIEGADVDPDLEATILDHFRQIKGDPARTIVIPIPAAAGDDSAQVRLRFERLSVEVKEASFRLYKADNALEICIAHGLPPYRIGWPVVGSLGGSTAAEMTSIYNDSIVQPRQETWEQRLDRTLLGAKGLAIADWQLKCAELDTRNQLKDLELSMGLYSLGVVRPNDVARFFGYAVREDPGGEEYIRSPLSPGTPAEVGQIEAIAKAAAWKSEVTEIAGLRRRIEGWARVQEMAA